MPLDIGMGIMAALFVAHAFAFHAGAFFITLGIVCALLPDLDMLPGLQRTHYDHRSYTHYPLVYLPLLALVYAWAGHAYGLLFGLCVFGHLVHDTIGIGWGVAWLWPFSKRKLLFPEAGRRKAYGFFMTWLPEEESAMAAIYHDPHWVRTYYLRPNPIAYIEYGTLAIALIFLVLYLR